MEIVHAPGMRGYGSVMAGWLGAQLQWKLEGVASRDATVPDRGGEGVTVSLREEPGRALG